MNQRTKHAPKPSFMLGTSVASLSQSVDLLEAQRAEWLEAGFGMHVTITGRMPGVQERLRVTGVVRHSMFATKGAGKS
jgi:hypothetical protein